MVEKITLVQLLFTLCPDDKHKDNGTVYGFINTDNDTFPKEFRHYCITPASLFADIFEKQGRESPLLETKVDNVAFKVHPFPNDNDIENIYNGTQHVCFNMQYGYYIENGIIPETGEEIHRPVPVVMEIFLIKEEENH